VYSDEPAVDAGIPELMFEDSSTRTRLSHRDLGFGVTQALPVLVSAAALTNRIITVEQPELHLHPAQQAELGDVFIESALGERKNTFLLETHSEHLILRIMKRIRQTHVGKREKDLPLVKPADVSVLYVEKVGTRSIVREFPLNERGELVKAWPKGFFEEGLREVLG
jgi:predicted ATPase